MQICFLNRRELSIRTLTSKINSLIPIEKSASFQFQSDTVQNKLLSHYGSNLVPRRGQGMSDIIISSRVTIDEVVIVAEELPTTEYWYSCESHAMGMSCIDMSSCQWFSHCGNQWTEEHLPYEVLWILLIRYDIYGNHTYPACLWSYIYFRYCIIFYEGLLNIPCIYRFVDFYFCYCMMK